MIAWSKLWLQVLSKLSPAAQLAKANAERRHASSHANLEFRNAPSIESEPEALLARSRLAQAEYLRRTGFGGIGETDGLVALHEAAAAANPGARAECLLSAAEVLADSGDFAGADDAFRRALESTRARVGGSPSEASILLRQARMLINAGDSVRAESILRRMPADGDGDRSIRNVRHFLLCEILRGKQTGQLPSNESNPPIEWFGP
jgi:tetratricopeptide (TPR) repeat protein